MVGHTHTEEARNFKFGSKFFDQPKNAMEFLMQMGTPSYPSDYTNSPDLNRSDSHVPLMIFTRYGFTLYKPGEYPKPAQYTLYDKF